MNFPGAVLVWCLLQVTLASFLGCLIYSLATKAGEGRLAAMGTLGIVLGLTFVGYSSWPSWLAERPSLRSMDSTPHAIPARGNDRKFDSGEKVHRAMQEPTGPLIPIDWRSLESRQTAPSDTEVGAGFLWFGVLAVVMLFCTLLGFLRLILGAVYVRRLTRDSKILVDWQLHQLTQDLAQRLGANRKVQLKQSSILPTAATVGWRRPVIFLPKTWGQWSDEQLRAVLAHEMAHIVKYDYLLGMVGQLVLAMHFYHPLVHWLARRLRLEQELTADAIAAQIAGGQETYLQSLAALTLRTDRTTAGWAIQTFLPTRSLFVRRIEMLKCAEKMESKVKTVFARRLVLGLLLVIGMGAVGLREPGRMAEVQAEISLQEAESIVKKERVASSQFDVPAGTEKSSRTDFDFSYIPEDILFLLAIRPVEMMRSQETAPIARFLSKVTRPSFPEDVLEQITLALPIPQRTAQGRIVGGTGSEFTVFRTNRPIDFKKPLGDAYAEIHVKQHNAKSFMAWSSSPSSIAFYAPNPKTLIGTPQPGLFWVMDNPESGQPSAQALEWQQKATGPIFGVLNLQTIEKMYGSQNKGKHLGGLPLQMVFPLIQNVQQILFRVEVQDPLRLEANLVCDNPEQVPMVEQTVRSILVLLQNIIASQRQSANDSDGLSQVWEFLTPMIQDVSVTSQEDGLLLTLPLRNPLPILKLLQDKSQSARQVALDVRSKNNLKRIALAFHNYHDSHGHFPPAVLYDKETRFPYSWRVAILPYLDQKGLYDQYHFNEPWDSEHNRKIADTMVPVYHLPNSPTPTSSAYYALVGPGTVFLRDPGKSQGISLKDIHDGTSNTLLVVEAKRNIPWTKPEDIHYQPELPLPQVGGFFPGGFNTSLVDGSVRFIPEKINPDTLRHLIEKSDGNVVDWSDQNNKLQRR